MRLLGLAFLIAGCGAATPRSQSAEEERRECTAAFRFAEPEEESEAQSEGSEPPRTHIAVALICRGEDIRTEMLGSEVGACFPSREPGALLIARCWWAGQGAVLWVERNGEELVIKRRSVGEEAESVRRNEERSADTREIARMPIPEGVSVEAL